MEKVIEYIKLFQIGLCWRTFRFFIELLKGIWFIGGINLEKIASIML